MPSIESEGPRLNLAASSRVELQSKLSSTDITVPFRTEGRTSQHCERYMAARLLSTLADTDELTFPLEIAHTDRPDFTLTMAGTKVGLECTEAVSEEWAQIDAFRERDFPEAMVMLPMLRPGKASFSLEERLAIAKGEKAGSPWVGKMAERQWAQAQAHFIEAKTKKLRAGNYSAFGSENVWLLIQDEWRVPVYGREQVLDAARRCMELIQPLLAPPAFGRIYIGNSKWLVRLVPGPLEIRAMRNLW